MFIKAGLEMSFPICGDDGVISKKETHWFFDCLSASGLMGLDLVELQLHSSEMQRLIGEPSSISLYQLIEKLITCLLKYGMVKESLKQIGRLI